MTKSAGSVLVTGANGALGEAVCERFLKSGRKVLAVYHPDHQSGPRPEKPGLYWHPMDVADSPSVRSGIASLTALHGPIGGLIHCAGGFRYLTIEQTTDADLDFLINVNLKSAFLLLRELIPSMKKEGFGRIVLVSSKSTQQAPAGMAAYAASKAGLNMVVSSVAAEVRDFDININAVLPTMIDTPANRKDMPEADFSTWVTRESLAEIIHSLTTEWGKPINGALVPVAGRL